MIEAPGTRRVRRWRSVSEKRQIVQLTLEPGARVAEVARRYSLNANQLFKWRRAYERGELNEPCSALLPVTVAPMSGAESKHAIEAHSAAAPPASIHIEIPGKAHLSIESGADAVLVRSILEILGR